MFGCVVNLFLGCYRDRRFRFRLCELMWNFWGGKRRDPEPLPGITLKKCPETFRFLDVAGETGRCFRLTCVQLRGKKLVFFHHLRMLFEGLEPHLNTVVRLGVSTIVRQFGVRVSYPMNTLSTRVPSCSDEQWLGRSKGTWKGQPMFFVKIVVVSLWSRYLPASNPAGIPDTGTVVGTAPML